MRPCEPTPRCHARSKEYRAWTHWTQLDRMDDSGQRPAKMQLPMAEARSTLICNLRWTLVTKSSLVVGNVPQ